MFYSLLHALDEFYLIQHLHIKIMDYRLLKVYLQQLELQLAQIYYYFQRRKYQMYIWGLKLYLRVLFQLLIPFQNQKV